MAEKNKLILWEVGCEGHLNVWVAAPNWEQATIEAAIFWGVPWREVAAYCVEKKRIEAPRRNICVRCKRIYYGKLPLCSVCEKVMKTAEEENQRRLRRMYQRMGQVI